MAQDYAKRRNSNRSGKSTTRKRKTTRKSQSNSPNVWRWYGAGVISGILACLLMYLVMLPPDADEPSTTPRADKSHKPTQTPPKPRFDFYTLLPEQTIEVEVDPNDIATHRTSPSTQLYLLQAGSFKQRKDADRRRAELILLGLEPKIEDSDGDNGRWFRVYVGPFESRSRLAKARSLTAAQNIDTLLLKRDRP